MNDKRKKKNRILALLFMMISLLSACSNKEVPELKSGTYQLEVKENGSVNEFIYPRITIKENGEFIFTISPLSSYLNYGSYRVKEDKLLCNTSDDTYHYVFQIEEDSLSISLEESSELNTYGMIEIKDGDKFLRIKDTE